MAHGRAARTGSKRDRSTLVHWRQSQKGQHIELGIAEVNLVGLLSELGLTWSRDGEPLLPIGTLYDPFITRALEPWSFGIYAGGQSILVGTPSGVTLAPEGGAHQSVITPSVGLEQPRCTAWEPAFVQDLEWAMLHALGRLGSAEGELGLLPAELPARRPGPGRLARRPQRAGSAAARRCWPAATGSASARDGRWSAWWAWAPSCPRCWPPPAALEQDGVACDVICLTSADLVFRAAQARRGLDSGPTDVLEALFPRERAAPMVAVLDGHPHTLSFLGTINRSPITCLGVSDFGQCGEIDDLYSHFGIDTSTIIGAAWDLLDEVGQKRA